MRSRTARGVAAVWFGAVFVALLGSGAGAYWGAAAAGSGSAETEDTLPVSLATGTPVTALFPGGTADVVVTVTNPNAAAVHIGSLSLDTGQGTDGYAVDPDHSDCAVSTLSFSTQSNGGAGWTVPGRVGAVDGTTSLTLTDAADLDTDAANACQGATFSVYLVVGP